MINQDNSRVFLGHVINGSLEQGLLVKIGSGTNIEDIQVGTPVTIDGQSKRFFGYITDMRLEWANQELQDITTVAQTPEVTRTIVETSAFSVIKVRPVVIIAGDAASLLDGPEIAKTIPPHLSMVYQASAEDVSYVFGNEDDRHIWIGSPLALESAQVCLNLEQFVKRSNGIFGKSGTGKSFLTRILLAGIVQKDIAVNLVFDMHNEYGWQGSSEQGHPVKGLKQLFNSQVAVFSLDPEFSRMRKKAPDFDLTIRHQDIEPEDIESLAGILNLTENARQASYKLPRELGSSWFHEFLKMSGEDIKDLSARLSEHESTMLSLKRRLDQFNRLAFIVDDAQGDSIQHIIRTLEQGIHVVLEFGRYEENLAAYILVANLLTRRIRRQYVTQTEQAMATNSETPKPLVITIEEAHKFLTTSVSQYTIFSTIAREMRKYGVTLLIVDQRPGVIEEEVLSQIGTKLTCQLDNERDVDALLTGTSGGRELKQVLSRLESKQQALIFGHSVPVPVVVRTREYGSPESYKLFQNSIVNPTTLDLELDSKDLFS